MPPDPLPDNADLARARHILKSARDAIEIVRHHDAQSLSKEMIRARAIVNCFTEIGEAARRLSDPARQRLGNIPWRQVVGLRNVVVHVYWEIDYAELLKTVHDDLPPLVFAIETALKSWPDPS